MRFSATFLVLACLACAPGYAAVLSAPGQTGSPGQPVTTSFSFTSEGMTISALQFDLEWDPALDVKVVLGKQLRQSAKFLYTAQVGTRSLRCLIASAARDPLPDGELLILFLIIDANASPGLAQVRVNNTSASGPDGKAVPLGSFPANVQIQQSGQEVQLVRSDGVLNAASLLPGPISPGEIITLLGSLPASDVTLTFNGTPAPILFNGLNQVNAVVPFGLDLSGPANLQVRRQGQLLAEISLPVSPVSQAIFTPYGGSGAGAVLNQDYSLNSAANPASSGSIIMIYGTGFGAMDPTPVDGQLVSGLATTVLPVTASIAAVPADVVYAGAAPGLVAGVVQVNVRIPQGITPGPLTPVSLQVGGVSSAPGVTISIQ